MISAEFAANERISDAVRSKVLIFQPWKWKTGPEIDQVCERVADMFSIAPANVHLFLSGRAALFHLMQALGAQEGDEAIVTGFTCEAVVLPLLEQKIVVKYSDINHKDCSISPENIRGLVSTRTRFLLIQHSFGIPPQRSKLISFARQHNLVVIEDLAHGWKRGVFEDDDEPTIKLLSFGRSKSLSSVFGGAIISNQKDLAITLNDVTNQLAFPAPSVLFRLLLYKPYAVFVKTTFHWFSIGKVVHRVLTGMKLIIPEISPEEKQGRYDLFFDKAYPNALATLLLHQLDRLFETEKTRRYTTQLYTQAFSAKIDDGLALARFPVLVKDRNTLLKQAKSHSWYFGKWYTQPVAPADLDLARVGYIPGSCPVSEEICDHIINLPTMVGEKDAHRIADLVRPHLYQPSQRTS